jgi:uncharacterized protein (UPF0264 family)
MPHSSCPRLLISVRSAAEAATALAAGADILDVKEPSRGSLGMASPDVITQIVAVSGGRVPVSVALGEWRDRSELPDFTGVTWAKLGFRDARGHEGAIPSVWRELATSLSTTTLIPVAYADYRRVAAPPFETILEWSCLNARRGDGLRGILIDTAVKDGHGLFSWYSPSQLGAFRESCAAAGLFLALAGSLAREDVRRLVNEVAPDVIAVRGAACRGNRREAAIDGEAVIALKALMQATVPA